MAWCSVAGQGRRRGLPARLCRRVSTAVRLNTTVTSLTGSAGCYVAKAGAASCEARQVVVATGSFQVPFVPPVAAQLAFEVV